jgi:hypothetical protein
MERICKYLEAESSSFSLWFGFGFSADTEVTRKIRWFGFYMM